MNQKNTPDGDNTVPVSTRLDRQIRHDLECLAKQERRPLANYIRKILIDHLEAERGKKGKRP